jgi:hypothetical protein
VIVANDVSNLNAKPALDYRHAWFPAMRKANPSLVLLEYENGTHSQPSFPSDEPLAPESAYSHACSGQRVSARRTGTGNWLMNPDDLWWRGFVADQAKAAKDRGYDGVMLDVMGEAPTLTAFESAPPCDPATGLPFTGNQWIGKSTALAAAVKARRPGIVITTNGLDAGGTCFPPIDSCRLLSVGPSIAETAWYLLPTTADMTLGEWQANVRMLELGNVWLVNKGLAAPNAAEREKWVNWTVTEVAMAGDPTSGGFYGGLSWADPTPPSGRWRIAGMLGTPTGPAHQHGGAIVRGYTNGGVIVVPQGGATTTFTWTTPVEKLNGDKVTTLTFNPGCSDVVIYQY